MIPLIDITLLRRVNCTPYVFVLFGWPEKGEVYPSQLVGLN